MNRHSKLFLYLLLAIISVACGNPERPCSINGGNIAVAAASDEECSAPLKALLQCGRSAVDSIKSPIIGTAAITLKAYPPESPLMNFAADALLSEAQKQSTRKIDIAITNKGGLRSDIKEGIITYGDIYNVFPFENTLAILSLNGEQLLQLFNEIAQVHGEAISGAKLIIAHEPEKGSYKLAQATVGGKKIDKNKKYTIATSDYLAQGNDGLHTLAQGSDRQITTISIRDLMINHIATLHKAGKAVSAKEDKRIEELIPTTNR